MKIKQLITDLNIVNSLNSNFLLKSSIFSAKNSVISVLFFNVKDVKKSSPYFVVIPSK